MRSAGEARLHVPSSNVVRAAATARSMSAVVPSGARPTSSSECGEITSMVALPAGSTHSPPMNSCWYSSTVHSLRGFSKPDVSGRVGGRETSHGPGAGQRRAVDAPAPDHGRPTKGAKRERGGSPVVEVRVVETDEGALAR